MTQAPVLSFRKELSLVQDSEQQVTVAWPGGTLMLNELTPGLLAAVQALSSGGATEDSMSAVVLDADGAGALAPLYFYLRRWSELNLLCYSVLAGDRVLATVVPMAGGFEVAAERLGVNTRFRLSRFAYCRREGDALLLESPLSRARTTLPGSTGGALVAELARPLTYAGLCGSGDGLTEDTAEVFVRLLASAALVVEVGEAGTSSEDDDASLAQWAFHDLLFHSRSRPGRHDYSMGGTFPFLGRLAPLPALKPRMSESVIALSEPELAQLEQDDPPFARVLEHRTSMRDYGDEPITARQLGEFLYRVARVRRVVEPDQARFMPYQTTSRPYPSGGATYDLELYLAIHSCAGIPAGMYHYDPLAHQLSTLAAPTTQVEALLRDAGLAAALSCEPQVLIVLASRFQRVSWKYSGLAYATTLKNVGVLYQSMYLAATAMGLAPCALGAGNSTLLAEAVGTDYREESSVGEFLLGSRPRP